MKHWKVSCECTEKNNKGLKTIFPLWFQVSEVHNYRHELIRQNKGHHISTIFGTPS